MEDIQKQVVIKKTNKGKILNIVGIVFFLIGAFCGGMCFFEILNAIITNNDFALALMILVLIIYGVVGLIASVVSLICNWVSYKKFKYKNWFQLTLVILSISALVITISSYLIWIISVKV